MNHASRYALDDACQYAGRDFAVSTQERRAGDAHSDVAVLDREPQVLVAHAIRRYEFLEGAELVLLPIGVIEVFVENEHAAGHDPIGQMVEHGLGRGVEIAVDVGEGHGVAVLGEKPRQGVFEPADVEMHVGGDLGQPAPLRELAAPLEGAAPILGQACEGIEAVHRALGALGKQPDTASVLHAEFED